MLSYQHIYHAANLADVHKHAVLAVLLDYLTHKPKAVTYVETHAGRSLYNLSDAAARKTGEAKEGLLAIEGKSWFAPDHPYRRALEQTRQINGPDAYPGSPALAGGLLRSTDSLHLAELHPQESAALKKEMRHRANIYMQDGFEMAKSICPPTPRRGVMLIDPSYELKTDYQTIPGFMKHIKRVWNVGIQVLWYPILQKQLHLEMLSHLEATFSMSVRHEVSFSPAKKNHRMTGSGLFIINPPFGLQEELSRLSSLYGQL